MEIHASSCFPSRRKFLFDILEKIRLETRIFKNIIFLRYLATLWLSIWYIVFFFIFRIDRIDRLEYFEYFYQRSLIILKKMEEEISRYIYVTLSWKELNYRNSRYLNGRRVVQRNYRKNWKSIPIEIVRMENFYTIQKYNFPYVRMYAQFFHQ